MKLFLSVLIVTLLGGAYGKKFTSEVLTPDDIDCIKQSGAKIEDIINNIDENLVMVEGNAVTYKVLECSLRKVDAVDENNHLKFNVLKTFLVDYVSFLNPAAKDKYKIANDGVEACRNTAGDSLGDQIHKFMNCFAKFSAKA